MIPSLLRPNSPQLIRVTFDQWDTGLLLLIVTILNLPLAFGGSTNVFRFSSQSFQSTHFLQLFTHPFTHVSWYHFLLDASAFFTLYPSLLERRPTKRLAFLAATGIGSLTAALLFHPEVATIGFCGLSGIAHGMMAVWSLQLIKHSMSSRPTRLLGFLSLTVVILKCAVELVWQSPVIGFAHFHLMGTPILPSHAGGVVGGLVAFFLSQSNEAIGKEPIGTA